MYIIVTQLPAIMCVDISNCRITSALFIETCLSNEQNGYGNFVRDRMNTRRSSLRILYLYMHVYAVRRGYGAILL